MFSVKFASLCLAALLLSAINSVFGAEFSAALYPPSWYKITKVEKNVSNVDITFEFYNKKELKSDGHDYSSEIVLLVQPPSSLKFVREKTEFATKPKATKEDYKDAYFFHDKKCGPQSDKGKCNFETWTDVAFGTIKDEVKLAAGIFKHSTVGLDKAAGDVASLSDVKYKNVLASKFKLKLPAGTYTWTGTYERTSVDSAAHFSKAAHDWIVGLGSKGIRDTLENSPYKGCIGTDAASAKLFFDQLGKDKHKILECGGLYEHDSTITGREIIYYEGFLKSIKYTAPAKAKNGTLALEFTPNGKAIPEMKGATHSTVEVIFADASVSPKTLRTILKREHLCGSVKLQQGHFPVAVSCQYMEETGTLLLTTDEKKPLKAQKSYKLEIDTSKIDHLLPESLDVSIRVTTHAKSEGDDEKPSEIETELTREKVDWTLRSSANLLAECKKRVVALYKDASARILKAKAELVVGYGTQKVKFDLHGKARVFGSISSFDKTHMIQLYVPWNKDTINKLITVKLTLQKDGMLKRTTNTIRHNLYPSLEFEYPSGFTIAPNGKSLEFKIKEEGRVYILPNAGYFKVPLVFDYSGNVPDLSADGVLKIEVTAEKKPVQVDLTTLNKDDKEFNIDASKSYSVVHKNIQIEYPHVVKGESGAIRVYVDFKTVVTKKMTFTATLDKKILSAEKVKGVLRSRNSGQYEAKLKGKNQMEIQLESAALNDYRDKFSFVLEFDASLKSQIEESTLTVKVNADDVHKGGSFIPNPPGFSFIDGVDSYNTFFFSNIKTKGLVYEKSYKLGDIVKKEKNDWIPCLSKRHQLVEVPISESATAVYYYTRVVDCLRPWSSPVHAKINKGYRLGSSAPLKASTEDLITLGLEPTENGKYSAARELLKARKLFRNTLYVLVDKTGYDANAAEFKLAKLCNGINASYCKKWDNLMKHFVEQYKKENADVVFHDVVFSYFDDAKQTLEVRRNDNTKETGDVFTTSEKYEKIEDFKTALDSILYHGYASLKKQDVKGTFSVFVLAGAKSVAQIKKETKEHDDSKSVAELKKGDLPHPIWVEIVPVKADMNERTDKCKEDKETAKAIVVDNTKVGTSNVDDFFSAFFNAPKEKVHSSYKYNVEKSKPAAGSQVPRPDEEEKKLYEVYVNYQPEVNELCDKKTLDAATGILSRFKRGASNGIKSTLATFKVFAACVHSDDVETLKKGAYLAYRGITATKFESKPENVLKRSATDSFFHESAACGPMSLYDNVPAIAKA